MNIQITITENKDGNVAVNITRTPIGTPTLLEVVYAKGIVDLIKDNLAKMCKAIGGTGAICWDYKYL